MKPVYLHRSIDLENVAYSDKAFKTRREAEESIRKASKFLGYVDALVIVRTYPDSFLEEVEDGFITSNPFQDYGFEADMLRVIK